MSTLITPEQRLQLASPRPAMTRRQFAGRAMAAAAGLALLPAGSRATSHRLRGEYQPKGSAGNSGGEVTFEGPIYGHVVSWDPEAWLYSLSSDELGYDYDYVSLSGVPIAALSNVNHLEVPFEDIDEAVDGAMETYLSQYGESLDSIEILETWESDEAVGTLWYWLDFDDKPYTYVEYSMTGEEGVWCMSYVQVRESVWNTDDMELLLGGIYVDDDPLVRAGDIEDIVAAGDDDL